MKSITEILGGAQSLLDISFDLQDCFEEYLTEENKLFLHILRLLEEVQPPLKRPAAKTGRPAYPDGPFLRASWAMRVFKADSNRAFIARLKTDPNLRLLCGFEKVPDESSFSRRFALFAKLDIQTQTLDALVKKVHEGKIVYHNNRDSTAIEAREKAVKPDKKPEGKKKRGRPEKGAIRPEKAGNTLKTQINQTAEAALEHINKNCAFGCKKNSQGNISFWRGYKLHLDVSDVGFPLTALVTGANVHDSRLAIPMEKMTEQKVQFCYSLMDSAYDAREIDSFIRNRERVPVIDPNKRKNALRRPLDPAKQERYKIRSTVERANSYLKDNLLPKNIYMKGHAKVTFVLLSAVVCLAAIRTLQYFPSSLL
jgi:transposase